jgi:chloramphenicol-sensitive protein RarD
MFVDAKVDISRPDAAARSVFTDARLAYDWFRPAEPAHRPACPAWRPWAETARKSMLRRTEESPSTRTVQANYARRGLVYAVLSYGLWGLVPLYFKLVAAVAPAEVVAQRIFWSFVLLAIVVTLVGRWRDVGPALRSPNTMLALAASTLLLAFNWFVYIYSVSTNQVVEASLGYFLLPLVNVLLGVTILGERLRRGQTAGIALALVGVIILGAPWIAVSLAVSFAFYGLLRKQVGADALLGLFIETLLLAPFALAFILYLHGTGGSAFVDGDPSLRLTLMASGVVTCVPLVLFAAAARRLRLATIGVLQYMSPTIQFFIAIFFFHEQLSPHKFVALAFIWTAVAIYAIDSLRMIARQRSLDKAPVG